jgi:ornithine carbamoyltransferase
MRPKMIAALDALRRRGRERPPGQRHASHALRDALGATRIPRRRWCDDPHFITIEQQSDGPGAIYELATSPFDDETLKGQGVALVFERPSLRTRASSSAAVHELGGYATFFSDEEIGLDSRESAEDVGRTLAEMYAIAALRVRNHDVFATHARGDERTAVADQPPEQRGPPDPGRRRRADASPTTSPAATWWVWPDSRCLRRRRHERHALAGRGAAASRRQRHGRRPGRLPADDRVDPRTRAQVAGRGRTAPHRLADDAVKGADVVYTDAWVSMGLEAETDQRRRDLSPFASTSN